MSDWEKVEMFVNEQGYHPEHLTMSEYIATMLLHLDGFSEGEEREISVDEFLENFSEYGTLEDYDY